MPLRAPVPKRAKSRLHFDLLVPRDLWNRLSGFDPADLRAAFAARDVVKAPLMRITLRLHAEDYRAFHAAMQPTRARHAWATAASRRTATRPLVPQDLPSLTVGDFRPIAREGLVERGRPSLPRARGQGRTVHEGGSIDPT